MNVRRHRMSITLVAAVLVFGCQSIATAGSHTWDVREVFSNACGTIQFIELTECCGGDIEFGVGRHKIISQALMNEFQIPSNLTEPTANHSLLFATPGFAALPGAPTPDYLFDPGDVPFVSTAADTLEYTVYDTFTFAGGELPIDGVNSIHITNHTTDAWVTGVNSPTNFAGDTGSIDLSCAVLGDVDGSGAVDGADVEAFVRVKLGAPNVGDKPFCADYGTCTLAGDIQAFVTDLLG